MQLIERERRDEVKYRLCECHGMYLFQCPRYVCLLRDHRWLREREIYCLDMGVKPSAPAYA